MQLDDLNSEFNLASAPASRSLAVTDDRKIRRDLFLATHNLLKKIRNLEKDHADFLRWDQILYEDWYNLTFRKERLVIEQLEKRYRTLTTFHMHLKHVAETSNVSFSRAYILLKEEEHQYQYGDQEWKFVIDRLRQQRLAWASKRDTEHNSKVNHAESLYLNEDLKGAKDTGLHALNRKARSVYHYLHDVSDEMMVRHFTDPMAGYDLFKESFQIAMKCTDWKLLYRIWKNSSPAYQQKLLKPMPSHLRDFLQQMINEMEHQNVDYSEIEKIDLLIRSTYRKLARRLHPDIPMATHLQEWASKMWQKVQGAYQARDLQALRKLELMCLAELEELNSMTLDEIYESSLVFADELETLKKNLKSYRKHPAWRFSSRRDYDSLTARIRRDLKKRYAPIEAEVQEMEKILKEAACADESTSVDGH